MNFWNNLPKPFTVLAPMEDVTDIVFRKVVAKAARPDVFVTEFTNAASFCNEKGNHSTMGRLTFEPDEQPIVAQIWGTNPDHFACMASQLKDRGFSGVDINMGCPAKDVVKIGAGSGLIKDFQLANEIIKATKSSGLPLSVKTRLGLSSLDERTAWLTNLLEQNIANLTVHLRTRKEMSKVESHFNLIPEIIKLRDQIAPSTKLTINGDIVDWRHIKQLANDNPAVDGYMIGRGVFKNIFCFEKMPKYHDSRQLIQLLRYHLDTYDKYCQISPKDYPNLVRNFDSLKHFFKIYISNFDGAATVREQLYASRTTDEAREVLNKYFNDHGQYIGLAMTS